MRNQIITHILILLGFSLYSQVYLSPEKPGFTEEITLTFKADEGNAGLKSFEGDIYAHTGLLTDQSTNPGDWKYVVADWGKNLDNLKLIKKAEDTWELKFKISELYGIPPAGNVTALTFVFRSADGSKVGKARGDQDIYYFLKEPDFKKAVEISENCLAPEPEWSRHANIYEVNVRQYTKEGTFNAFSEHLPRLREMGVNILWFMPIQPIGLKNRKGSLGSYYSIQDYKGINPEFGTFEDFRRLVAKAHGMGFKVILDWVANHSAWDNEWITKHPDWYARDTDGNIIAPYDWTDVAKLNFDQYYMRKAMMESMEFWVREADIDGYRCDVAGEVPIDFWEEVRLKLEAIKPVWMIAEDADKHFLMNKAFNANYGWPFHHLMNEIAKGKTPANAVYEQLEKTEKSYPKGSYPMQFITNHDENSWNGTEYERLGNGTSAFAVLYYTIPGMPLIYSGQEAATKKRLLFFEKDPIDWTDKSLIPFYTSLNKLKSENPALWNGKHGGDLQQLTTDQKESVVAFSRNHDLSKIVVVINLSDKNLKSQIEIGENTGHYIEYFTGKELNLHRKMQMDLAPWEYRVYIYQGPKKNDIRTFKSVEKSATGLKIHTNDGSYQLTPYSENAVEVSFEPTGSATNPPSYGISANIKKIKTTYKEDKNRITYSTPGISIHIQKSPFRISYLYKNKELTKEADGYFDGNEYSGFSFQLRKDEKLTGGGMRVLGMDRRGKRLRLYNKPSFGYETHADQMYYSLPVAISSQKYMLIFDNGADGYMDLGATDKDKLSFEASGGRMSYIVVAGDKWQDLISNYTDLTGKQPLPSKWTLGNIASRMGYHSQTEVENVVKLYEDYKIPLDAVVLDLYWFGKELKGTLGNLEWYRDSFPNPEKMMSDFKNKGIKTVLITEPFVIENTLKFGETVENNLLGKKNDGAPYLYDFYFGKTGLLDIFNPETQKWFWNIYKRHTASGVAGWWGDLGEPEVHPDDMLHVGGRGKDLHNLYGHVWAKTIFDGYKKDFPTQRPLILMRSGFVGSQRYGMIPWSGDVSRSWGGLQPQVEISLTMGMQGLAYMHSDLGGFSGEVQDPELYTRWLQYGVFQPVFRTHAQEEIPSEPVFWDKKTRELATKSIRLRYAMLPYNYTLLWENNTTGMPLMRPLFYEEDRPDFFNETGTYLWGSAFLVSPVVAKNAKKQKVVFPKGSNWINFSDDKVYSGDQTVFVETDPSEIPVFVRAGSFVPMISDIQNTDQASEAPLMIHYYHHISVSSSEGKLYEDDGNTPEAFEKGLYQLTGFKAIFKNKVLTIHKNLTGNGFTGQKKDREITYIIHGVEKDIKNIFVQDKSGKKAIIQTSAYKYDDTTKTITLKLDESVSGFEIQL
ncbi:MAG: DUF4968 domain-containing protein [Saprospiraceae bacterium]|nr:DUF4968 domain-containing protein [Saprospiraceae bacterium]